MAHAKIIGIHDGKHIETRHSARPLSMPIIKLRDEVKELIKNLLRNLFDNADDALFAMSDKAGTNGDQNIYLDSMRELRLQKKTIANTFMQQVVLSFTNVDYFSGNTAETTDSDGLETLSILKDDELEVSVALEGMISRLRNTASGQLDDLHKRLESQVSTNDLKTKHTPAGPEVLCDAFAFASSELDVDLKAKLIIFKLFEKYVLSEMPTVYQHANQTLVQLGVLPNLKKQRFINNASLANPASNNQQGRQNNQSSNSNEYMNFEPVNSGQNVPVLGKEQCITEGQFEQIRTLMHSGSPTHEANQGNNQNFDPVSGSNIVFLNQDQIISTLSQQQFSQSANTSENVGCYQPVDFRSLIANAYVGSDGDQADKKIKYDEIDNDIINLVSMLFDFILDDRQLQSSMKVLIARLQIPILKVALIDKSFFDRGGHPARKLLNEMASAAIGWTEKNTGKLDRLKDKIESVVERVLSDFDSNLELFSELLQEFTQFTDIESRRGQLIEQRTKDSERGKAATEIAKKTAETVINTVLHSKSFSTQELPECVLTLLQDGWSRVMILDYLKLGAESSEWKGHQQFIYDLVWSVCPTEDGSDARGKLLQLIPNLMRRLHQGLQEASFDEFRLTSLLRDLEKNHISTLKRLHKQALVEQEVAAKLLADNQLKLDSQAAPKVEPILTVEDTFDNEGLKCSLDIEEDFKEFQEKLSSKEINDVLAAHQETVEPKASVQVSLTESAVEVAEISIDDNDPFMQQVSRFSVGCWFEFSRNGQTERAKLAAVIKINGRYIFVNRSGVKIAEKTKQELAVDLKSGLIQVLNDGLLFDRALESVIGNLRGQS
tara:strand:+ start:849 stop:3350 length:2502 start_codon:yes stop_codon:yes gene_type:complete